MLKPRRFPMEEIALVEQTTTMELEHTLLVAAVLLALMEMAAPIHTLHRRRPPPPHTAAAAPVVVAIHNVAPPIVLIKRIIQGKWKSLIRMRTIKEKNQRLFCFCGQEFQFIQQIHLPPLDGLKINKDL